MSRRVEGPSSTDGNKSHVGKTAYPEIDTSFYLQKKPNNTSMAAEEEMLTQFDEENSCALSDTSMVTVIFSQQTPQMKEHRPSTPITHKPSPTEVPVVEPIIELSDTPPLNKTAATTLQPPLVPGESHIPNKPTPTEVPVSPIIEVATTLQPPLVLGESHIPNKPSPTEVPVSPIIEVLDTPPLDNILAATLKPPLWLNESYTSGEYFYLEIYEHPDPEEIIITGICTLRLALNDERIKDRSEEVLQHQQFFESDIYKRDKSRGVFDEVDQAILAMKENPCEFLTTCVHMTTGKSE